MTYQFQFSFLVTLLVIVTLFYSCSPKQPSECSNRLIIVQHRGKYLVECFNRFIDSSKAKPEVEVQFYNQARRLQTDTIGEHVSYSLNGNKLEFLDKFDLILNDSLYQVRKFGNINPPIDGGYNYYFLDGYGFIYEKSTTWFSSIKILKTENEKLNEVLPGLFELLQREECSKSLNIASEIEVPIIE